MRVVVMVAVVIGALSSRVHADDATPACHPAVLVGGGVGFNGLGDIPGPLVEVHAGGGWRASRWTFAGLASYAWAKSEAILASWSITRHDIEAMGVVAYRPMSRRGFLVHGQLGIGAAFDRLTGVDPEGSANALSASAGVGVGWSAAALTVRYVLPTPLVCTGSCYRGAMNLQLMLSVTLDAYPAK
jgi:hypothetical protein